VFQIEETAVETFEKMMMHHYGTGTLNDEALDYVQTKVS